MARFPLVPTAPEPERAVLVGVEWRDNAWPLDRSLDELERLTPHGWCPVRGTLVTAFGKAVS